MLQKALIKALKVNGIKSSVMNSIRIATFHLAALEPSNTVMWTLLTRNFIKSLFYTVTDNAFKGIRELLSKAEKGEYESRPKVEYDDEMIGKKLKFSIMVSFELLITWGMMQR